MSDRGITKFQIQMAGWLAIGILLGAVWISKTHPSQTQPQCRCFPGDACWPSISEWNLLNTTVGGRLIATVPIGSPCHDTFPGFSYDAQKCAIRTILDSGGIMAGVSMDVSNQPTSPNAVNPAWRDSLFLAFFGTIYNETSIPAVSACQEVVTNLLNPALENLMPNPAAYLNEADFHQPNWQRVFYGENYPKLVSIKTKYDLNDIFWGPTVVRSEAWTAAADDRLCKTE